LDNHDQAKKVDKSKSKDIFWSITGPILTALIMGFVGVYFFKAIELRSIYSQTKKNEIDELTISIIKDAMDVLNENGTKFIVEANKILRLARIEEEQLEELETYYEQINISSMELDIQLGSVLSAEESDYNGKYEAFIQSVYSIHYKLTSKKELNDKDAKDIQAKIEKLKIDFKLYYKKVRELALKQL